MTTSAPASANARAIAAPNPRPAPVTTATWSSNRNLSSITSAFLRAPGDTVTRARGRHAAFLKHVLVDVGTQSQYSFCDPARNAVSGHLSRSASAFLTWVL